MTRELYTRDSTSCSSFGASILKVTYGLEISDPSDEHLSTAEETTRGLSEAFIPGKYWLDMFPPLKYVPTWMPGTVFHHVALKYKPYIKATKEAPWKEAQDTWVSK